MAATKARTRARPSSNGAVSKVNSVGESARRAAGPVLAAGAAGVAGLAGGLLIGSRRRKKSGAALAIATAKRFVAVAGKASHTADDLRAIREQLENANRRSPIEVVLDGLTHRPGTGKRERQFNIGS